MKEHIYSEKKFSCDLTWAWIKSMEFTFGSLMKYKSFIWDTSIGLFTNRRSFESSSSWVCMSRDFAIVNYQT